MVVPQEPGHALPPEIRPVCTTVHVKVVPAAVLLNEVFAIAPLHMATVGGVAETEGVGFTVTVAVAVAEQPLAVPVIV